MKKFVFLILILTVLILAVGCGNEAVMLYSDYKVTV